MTIPDWAHYVGMNDRFAALGPRSAAKWKERLAYTLQHCLQKPLHAEMFAQDFAVDHDFDVRLPCLPHLQRSPQTCPRLRAGPEAADATAPRRSRADVVPCAGDPAAGLSLLPSAL